MKKYLAIAIPMMISLCSFGQVRRTVEKPKADSANTEQAPIKKDGSRKELLRALDLTKEQKAKLKEINQSMRASREAIESDSTLSDMVKKEKLRSLRKEQAQKTQAILTDEQKKKFRELREQNKNND